MVMYNNVVTVWDSCLAVFLTVWLNTTYKIIKSRKTLESADYAPQMFSYPTLENSPSNFIRRTVWINVLNKNKVDSF